MNDRIKGYADFISGQIDELSKKTLGSYIKKNVDQQTDLTYAHGSDPEEYETNPENPRKIQKRSAGLDMAVKKLTKEESKSIVDAYADFISGQIDELSKKTLGSYVKKNVQQQTDLTYQHGSDPEEYETNPENPQKIHKRKAGLDMAVKKLSKEETESAVNAYADFISKQIGDISEYTVLGNSSTNKKPKQEPHKNDPVTKSPKKDNSGNDHDLSTKTQTHTAPANKTPSKTPMREPTKFPPGSKVTPSFPKGNPVLRKIHSSKNEAIEFSQEEIDTFAAIVNEAAKKGTERVSYHGGIIHKVLHSDKKTGDHLTMSYSEEPGSVYFHGRMNGKKIRVDSASDHGDQPTHQDFARDLKKAHPDLPKETHEKIGKIAKKGLKELEYGED